MCFLLKFANNINNEEIPMSKEILMKHVITTCLFLIFNSQVLKSQRALFINSNYLFINFERICIQNAF